MLRKPKKKRKIYESPEVKATCYAGGLCLALSPQSALVVSKILGHANPSMTLSIYAHATLDMQSQAAGIMDEIVSPIPVQLHPIAPAEKKAE